MSKKPSVSSLRLFGREWVRSLRSDGPIAPLSSRLAQAICEGHSDTDGPITEPGPGTAVFIYGDATRIRHMSPF